MVESPSVTALRDEPRFFGPSARCNPKPFPSLLSELQQRDGFRLAAMIDGNVVGLIRVGGSGDVHIAVVVDRRGRGIGTDLLRAAVARAGRLHHQRLTLRSSEGSRAVRRLGDAMGCTTVGYGRGRVDLILPVPRLVDAASA